jgi:hypothetical protein
MPPLGVHAREKRSLENCWNLVAASMSVRRDVSQTPASRVQK